MLPFVSVVVVNFNGRAWLGECLRSLEAQSYPRHRREIWLIDNGSTDDSLAIVRAQFPGVHIVEARDNLGFAAGNNLGFTRARGEWVALLNTDAAADPDWLMQLVNAGETAVDIGGVASHLVFHDRPDTLNGTGLELYRDGRAGDRDLGGATASLVRPAGGVFGGCGAAVLYRQAMLQALGGFDPSLFMYYEDLDLAWRARRRGWRFEYAPLARVRHVCGGSAGVASPLQLRCIERNRARINLFHAPVWLAIATLLGLIARTIRCMWRCAVGRLSSSHAKAHAAALGDVVMRLPRDVLRRWQLREPGDNAQRIYRVWSRPAPR